MAYLIPNIEQSSTGENLYRKLSFSQKILKDDFLKRIQWCDAIELVDKDKVSFQVNQSELSDILQNGGFSLAEQAYIRRLRHQGRNNKAAKKLRDKKKTEEVGEEQIIDSLTKLRDELAGEREELRQEIDWLKNRVDSQDS